MKRDEPHKSAGRPSEEHARRSSPTDTNQIPRGDACISNPDLLRAVLESTTDAVFVKDLQGCYLMANDVVAGIVGADVIGKNDLDFFPVETARRIMADDRSIIANGKPATFEQTLEIGGSTRTYMATKAPYRDHRGVIIGLVGISRDITDHIQTEKALRESDTRARESLNELEHVYATAPVGLCLLGTDLRFLRINELMATMNGLPVEEHFGKSLREIVPEVAELADPVCRAAIESGEPALDLEFEAPTPTRPMMAVLVSIHPLKSEEGDVRALSVVVQDITEIKQAEAALRESEERLSHVLQSAMDAIVTVDEHLLIQIFNEAAEDVFRCKAEQVIGQSFERFASEALRQLLADCVRAFGRRPMSKRYMWAPEGLTAIRADGEAFPVEATISQAEASGQNLYTIIMRDVNDRQQAERELRELQRENIYLREEVKTGLKFEDIVGESDAIRRVLDSVEQVATSDSTVLITGETGTGKELIARAIHNLSTRRGKLLVNVNCAALPVGLIESELFGHEKGAFTGALTRQIGRFELAHGGTIFLDEIGDLPLELQAKILRVLQEGEFERVGGSKTLKVDVRVIAATNQDLEQAMEQQRFRPDLYYRVNVFPIRMPCLRERREDIPLLARHFAMMYSAKMGKKIDEIPPSVLQALAAYHWPGNIRELQNVMERAVIISRGISLEIGEWPPKPIVADGASCVLTLEELEREHILEVLKSTGWRVSGEKGAAKILGMKPTTLQARMTKFGIKRPD